MDSYWNQENDDKIICPYCGEKYEPSYDETCIGGKYVDCFAEGEDQEFTCDNCGKKFTLVAYQAGWRYETETIDGEMSEEEYEENWG